MLDDLDIGAVAADEGVENDEEEELENDDEDDDTDSINTGKDNALFLSR